MNKAHYQVRAGAKGLFHVILAAPNNECLGTTQTGLAQNQAQEMIIDIRTYSQDPKNFRRMMSDADKPEPYFLLCKPDGDIIFTSEMYSAKDGRENGIEAVMKYAPTLDVIYK